MAGSTKDIVHVRKDVQRYAVNACVGVNLYYSGIHLGPAPESNLCYKGTVLHTYILHAYIISLPCR